MTQIILIESMDNLGKIGEVVDVKPGYARNFLLPQGKALRATKSNLSYFETKKAELEKQNEARRNEAQKKAKQLEGAIVNIIQAASEGGQLYGSVRAKGIAEAIREQKNVDVSRNQVVINQALKSVGLVSVDIYLHPEVPVLVTLNIARSEDEAEVQAKTGVALVAGEGSASVEEVAAEALSEAEQILEEEQAEEFFENPEEAIAQSEEQLEAEAEESSENAEEETETEEQKSA